MTEFAELPPPRRRSPAKGIPVGLPYQALGLDSRTIYVLDPNFLLCRIPRNQISRSWLVGLFGNEQEKLYEIYGRMREIKGELVAIPHSFHSDRCADDLQKLAAAAGAFDEMARVRGVGAWRGEGDDLILNLGDQLYIPTATGRLAIRVPLGRRGDYIYLRRPPVPAPFNGAVGCDTSSLLLDYLKTWRWQRALDPVLLLGLIGSAFLAGALEHRPQVDVTGESGVGKSGLQHIVRSLLGARMILSSDATAAGIRQRAGCDAVCIGLDEAESSTDPKRISDMQALRRASYGQDGESIRGSVDHAAALFPLRSVFLSSAITLPPMDAAMKSRVPVITLLGPPKDDGGYVLARSDAAMEVVGAKLLRRLADHWPRLIREVLPTWRAMLESRGCDGRTSATYGTLLACAFVLVSDGVPRQRDYEQYAGELESLMDEERQDRLPSHRRLLQCLGGAIPEPTLRSGKRLTVMEKLLLATGYGDRPESWAVPEALAINKAKTDDAAIEAARELRQIGITIGESGTGARMVLFSNTSPWIESALRNTPFAALAGRAEGHALTLLRCPGAKRVSSARFGHGCTRAVAVPLSYILSGMVGPNPEEAARTWDNIMVGDPLADES